MSSSRLKDESKKGEYVIKCNRDLRFFKQLAHEKCRIVPFAFLGTAGHDFTLLHGHKACATASVNYINLLVQCQNLPRPK